MQEDFLQSMPLATQMRPENLEDYVGQKHLLDSGKILKKLIETDNIISMIFWGPPGVGKTTLAKIIAKKTKSYFIEFSATTSNTKEIKQVMSDAEKKFLYGKKTIIFIDEIHRFNKAQQDIFLKYLESGLVILIGATTENPSFEINSALLSRCKIFVLNLLSHEDLEILIHRAIKFLQEKFKIKINIESEIINKIINFANGDARILFNILDMLITGNNNQKEININKKMLEFVLGKKILLYDKHGDEHFNLISALHKSMRNSDVDAAIYWLARMLESGEDPLYIARRVIRFASEDIGLANNRALDLAINAYHACHFLGMPECNINLTHAIIFCSVSPKSNAAYVAYEKAKRDAQETINMPVPLVIRNAPTQLMRDLDFGKDYKYAHDIQNKIPNMQCLPDALRDKKYYNPTDHGQEKYIQEELIKIRKSKK